MECNSSVKDIENLQYALSDIEEELKSDNYRPELFCDIAKEYGLTEEILNRIFLRNHPKGHEEYIKSEKSRLGRLDKSDKLSEEQLKKIAKDTFSRPSKDEFDQKNFGKKFSISGELYIFLCRCDDESIMSITKGKMGIFMDANLWWHKKPREISSILRQIEEL